MQLVKLDDYYKFTKILFLSPNKVALSHMHKNTWRLIDLNTRNITTYDPKLEKHISSIFGVVGKRVVLSLNYCRSISRRCYKLMVLDMETNKCTELHSCSLGINATVRDNLVIYTDNSAGMCIFNVTTMKLEGNITGYYRFY